MRSSQLFTATFVVLLCVVACHAQQQHNDEVSTTELATNDVQSPGVEAMEEGDDPLAHLPIQFTPDNEDELTSGKQTVLVAFLARPAPVFETQLVELKPLLQAHDGLELAVANCAEHPEFIGGYGLTIFPALRVFPAGILHTPFTIEFTDDLLAAKLLEILQTYEHAVKGLPPAWDESQTLFLDFLFGKGRGNATVLQAARTSAEEARAAMEEAAGGRQPSPLFLHPFDVDYERSRYYEFILLRSKHIGPGFIANELNKVRGTLQMSPRFVRPAARTALLIKLHVLKPFEQAFEFQSLDEEVDENFVPTGWNRQTANEEEGNAPQHVEL